MTEIEIELVTEPVIRNNIRQTCVEMLEQRGFIIDEEDDDMIIGVRDSDYDIVVFFDCSQKLDTDKVKVFIAKMKELELRNCIIVYKESVTAPARKVIEELQEYKLEIFKETELRYNITKHRLVPTHSALTKAESIEFKKQYGVKIPVILKTDAVAKFYNFQKGEIIKIERTDGTVSFRIVK
jgi:DNA-directed RNA polymerase I, II, and III subunit RPABC1